MVARNTVRAYTICLDMTITQANYWLVYRRLANNLMFSRHAYPSPYKRTHAGREREKGGKGGGEIDREDGWRARGKSPTRLTD